MSLIHKRAKANKKNELLAPPRLSINFFTCIEDTPGYRGLIDQGDIQALSQGVLFLREDQYRKRKV